MIYDPTNATDPYWKNPLIPALFINFTSWKNAMNGAMASFVGDVRLINFKVADNLLAGIEFEKANYVGDGHAQINGAVVIGRSLNADSVTNSTPLHGIITPRSDGLRVINLRFYNFDVGNMSAIGSCSHCWFPTIADSGARTTKFWNLYFDKSVKIKIRYQEPYMDIFQDMDGTLTGLGPNTWTTPYFEHNMQPECLLDKEVYDGIVCNSSVQVRRITFYNYQPYSLTMMSMKIV